MVSIVSISEFLSRKNSHKTDLSYIADKYDTLFKTYPCFLETPPVPYIPHIPPQYHSKPSPPFYGRKRHHHVSKSAVHGHSQQQRRPICKDPSRIITGYLNVINVENYSRVFMKIRLLLDNDNVHHMVKEILQKCWTATIYINVYIKLLSDISTIYNIHQTLFDCVMENIARFEFKSDIPDSYDLFCEKQKHKMFVLGLNITLIKLSKAGLISHDVLKNYVDLFEKRISKETDEYTIDIILHIFLEICKSYRGIIEDPQALASTIHSDIPRIRFLIQELAEIH